MDESKEVKKQMFINFIVLYFITVILLWLGLNVKFNWSLTKYDYSFIMYFPLFSAIIQVIFIKFRMSYVTHSIEKSPDNIKNLSNYIFNKKTKIYQINNDIEYYILKSKHSLLPLRFSIKKSNKVIELRVPKAVGNEILKYLRVEK